jgi:hypothetical protein
MRLEVVVLPVSDVDRASPCSIPCSIIFGTGITTAAPGSADGLSVVVDDIEAAWRVFHHAGTTSRAPGWTRSAAAMRHSRRFVIPMAKRLDASVNKHRPGH